jgi:hypothetical protein
MRGSDLPGRSRQGICPAQLKAQGAGRYDGVAVPQSQHNLAGLDRAALPAMIEFLRR